MTMLFPTPTIPAGMTVMAAMTLGLLPVETQITNFGSSLPNATVGACISSGLLSPAALASTLTYAATYANYGGN
jgi:hypothetical protein